MPNELKITNRWNDNYFIRIWSPWVVKSKLHLILRRGKENGDLIIAIA